MQIFPLRWGRVPARAGEGYPSRKKTTYSPEKTFKLSFQYENHKFQNPPLNKQMGT